MIDIEQVIFLQLCESGGFLVALFQLVFEGYILLMPCTAILCMWDNSVLCTRFTFEGLKYLAPNQMPDSLLTLND